MKKLTPISFTFLIFAVVLFAAARVFDTQIILMSSITVLHILELASAALAVLSAAGCLTAGFMFLKKKVSEGVEGLREEREQNLIEKGIKTDPVLMLKSKVTRYLKHEDTTPFFQEKLTALLEHLDVADRQYDNVIKVAVGRFSEGTMSYAQFVSPVEKLMDHLIKLGLDLIQKLEMFDEARYQAKIKAVGQNQAGAQEYIDVMSSYQEFTSSILQSFENAAIRFDKLILEIGKLNNEDLAQSIAALEELDSVIVNTKLYRD